MQIQFVSGEKAEQSSKLCAASTCPPTDEAAAHADVEYNRLKNSGELRREEDARALAIQIREGMVQ